MVRSWLVVRCKKGETEIGDTARAVATVNVYSSYGGLRSAWPLYYKPPGLDQPRLLLRSSGTSCGAIEPLAGKFMAVGRGRSDSAECPSRTQPYCNTATNPQPICPARRTKTRAQTAAAPLLAQRGQSTGERRHPFVGHKRNAGRLRCTVLRKRRRSLRQSTRQLHRDPGWQARPTPRRARLPSPTRT